VQVRQVICNNRPRCNKATRIKYGNSVITIDGDQKYASVRPHDLSLPCSEACTLCNVLLPKMAGFGFGVCFLFSVFSFIFCLVPLVSVELQQIPCATSQTASCPACARTA
jgi:hypothetical protein